jgi:hypothetical protein
MLFLDLRRVGLTQTLELPIMRTRKLGLWPVAATKRQRIDAPVGGFLSLRIEGDDRWPRNCTHPQNGEIAGAILIATVRVAIYTE